MHSPTLSPPKASPQADLPFALNTAPTSPAIGSLLPFNGNKTKGGVPDVQLANDTCVFLFFFTNLYLEDPSHETDHMTIPTQPLSVDPLPSTSIPSLRLHLLPSKTTQSPKIMSLDRWLPSPRFRALRLKISDMTTSLGWG